jgi:hypothetical protein
MAARDLQFTVPEKDRRKAERWFKRHECSKLNGRHVSPIYARALAYVFVPTGIGNAVYAMCRGCDLTLDMTDVSSW